MKYNSGDIDDLFRRASEDYPLRTDGADWNRLASALDSESVPPSDKEEDRRRRRGLFWWFLLIPLAGAGYLTWQVGMRHSRAGQAGMDHIGARLVAVAPAGANEAVAGANSAGANVAGANVAGANAPGKTKAIGKTNAVAGSNAVPAVTPIVASGAVDRSNAFGTLKHIGGPNVFRRSDASHRSNPIGESSSLVGLNLSGKSDPLAAPTPTGESGAVDRSNAGAPSESTTNHDPALALLDLRPVPLGGGYHVDVNVMAPAKTPELPKHQGNSHAYVGLSGAPDFSTVRFQSMKGVGETFGLLIGYAFNDRWAIESGLYLDQKRYYTEGEYFKGKVPMSGNYQLLNVDGTCYMWEIPLNVRYNFSNGPRMNWFVTAGLSTYLMSRENYTYQFEYNWSVADSNWENRKPSQYWFSIVNLSAGFEQRLGKIGNLRLEPYIRIPTSGIGTGKLAIMSAGLNIGLTRRLW